MKNDNELISVTFGGPVMFAAPRIDATHALIGGKKTRIRQVSECPDLYAVEF